jgi:hypothetical protein
MANDCTVMRDPQGQWREAVAQHDGLLVYFGLEVLLVKFEDLPGFFARGPQAGHKMVVQAVQGGVVVPELEPTVEPVVCCQHPADQNWKLGGAQCPRCGTLHLTKMIRVGGS